MLLSSEFSEGHFQNLALLFVYVGHVFIKVGYLLLRISLVLAIQLLQIVTIAALSALPLEDFLEVAAEPINARPEDPLLWSILHSFAHYKIHYTLMNFNSLDQTLRNSPRVEQSFLKFYPLTFYLHEGSNAVPLR